MLYLTLNQYDLDGYIWCAFMPIETEMIKHSSTFTFSVFPREFEVLLPPGMYFEVLNSSHMEGGL